MSVPRNGPLNVQVEDRTCTETRMTGHVKVTEADVQAHPERMRDAGEMRWDITIRKQVAYHVDYGASKLFRSLNAWDIFWHTEGMKTAFQGRLTLNGEAYVVGPEDCYGDKNWGGAYGPYKVFAQGENLAEGPLICPGHFNHRR